MSFENYPTATATITVTDPVVIVPAHDVEHPAEAVYSTSFEDSPLGWVSLYLYRTPAPAPVRTGTYSALLSNGDSGGATDGKATKTVSGLTVGRAYTLTAYAKGASVGSSAVSLGVTGKSYASATLTSASPWTLLTYTFTATSTSHELYFTTGGTSGGPGSYWEDLTLTRDAWTEHVPDVTTTTPELILKDGSVDVDLSWSPYIQARFTVPLTDEELLEQIDPYGGQRIDLTASNGSSTLDADLLIVSRRVSHDRKELEIEAASDEAVLQGFSKVAHDSAPRTYAANLRNLINYVLGEAGLGTLESGTANADLTPAWTVNNLVPNPDIEGSTTGYLSGSANTPIAYNSGTGVSGAGFLRGTQAAASGAIYLTSAATAGYPVTPGHSYVVACYERHSTSGASATMTIRWYNQDNVLLKSDVQASVALPTAWPAASALPNLSIIRTAPPGATKLVPFTTLASSASGRTWDVDRVMVYEETELVPWFDGNETATSLYTYSWADGANASTSTRTPVVDRPRELFTWKAGVSAWDFLVPLVSAAGLRLFADENRKFYLVNPAEYSVAGRVSVSEGITVEGSDTIDVLSDEGGYTGAVVYYRWTDQYGIQQEQIDTAGVEGKVKTVTREDTPYTGPGAAALILRKLQGLGRVQDVTARTRYTVRPGMEIQIDLPGTSAQVGTLSRIRWELTKGLMSLSSTGLKETPDGAIDLLSGTIDALSGTIDSLNP